MKRGRPLRRRSPLKTGTGELKRTTLKRSSASFSRVKGARSGETVTCAREGCEVTFYVIPSQLGRRRCCSFECSRLVDAERQKVTRVGVGNPNHRHGKRAGEHDRELARVFNLTLKGEDSCRNCHSKKHVQLHHAIPRGLGSKESRLSLLNGLPLCAACHTGWHRHWLVITRDVFSPEEWVYLLAVSMRGRVTEAWLDDRYPVEARVPVCERGHVLDPANIASNGAGKRTCRRCKTERRAAA